MATVVCEYCNQSASVSHTVHMPAAPMLAPPASTPRQPPPPATLSRGGVIAVWVFTGFVGLGALVAIPMVMGLRRTRHPSATRVVVPPSESVHWAGGPLVTTDIDGDGDEDLIGFYRTIDNHGTAVTYVGGFTSRGWKRVWRSRGLGPHGEVGSALGLVGVAVLFSDDKGVLHVLDRTTGTEQKQIALSDRAEQICGIDATHAWISVTDETSVNADLTAGSTTPGSRPASCRKATAFAQCSRWDSDDSVTPHAVCFDDADTRVKVPDMRVSYAVRAGEHGIAVGTKQKGTTSSMLAGFDATHPSAVPLWVRRVNPDASAMTPTSEVGTLDIVGDAAFLAYALDSKVVKLQRLDAATGAIQFEVVVPNADIASMPRGLVITNQRIYVAHFLWLDIFDVKTGAHLQTIGQW